MTSRVDWLDSSREEQRRMRELLNLFTETESRDELGIGQVRDAFSDSLFPGTSTLHTRARYFLLIPWCFQEAEARGLSGMRLTARVDANERKALVALRDAGETEGLIGKNVGVKVKTLPSSLYWSALNRYGIYLGRQDSNTVANRLIAKPDLEASELVERAPTNWYPTLPSAPPGFPGVVEGGLALSNAEATWLRERMLESVPGTLLEYFLQVENRTSEDSPAPWDEPCTAKANAELRHALAHAELFSQAMHGAALLYNLLIAEFYEREGYDRVQEPADSYRQQLGGWIELVRADRRLDTWDVKAMWDYVELANPRIAVNIPVKQFVNSWISGVLEDESSDIADSNQLRNLVHARELLVKKAQSRLANRKLLAEWSGHSGTSRLTFRWGTVRKILRDIQDGLESSNAAS